MNTRALSLQRASHAPRKVEGAAHGGIRAARVRRVVRVEGHHVGEHVVLVAVLPRLAPQELEALALGEVFLHSAERGVVQTH